MYLPNSANPPFHLRFKFCRKKDSSENLRAITCSSLLGHRVSNQHPSLRVTCRSGNLCNFIGRFIGSRRSDEVLRSHSFTRELLSSFVINKDIHMHRALSLEHFPQT